MKKKKLKGFPLSLPIIDSNEMENKNKILRKRYNYIGHKKTSYYLLISNYVTLFLYGCTYTHIHV